MGKNKNKGRQRAADSGASGAESDTTSKQVQPVLQNMHERVGSKVVTMADSVHYETPEMQGGSYEGSAGFQPIIKSFFKPLITPRGKKPRFVSPTSGVPPKLKKAWGYWRPQHKTAVKSGNPITLWYYYELGDGPYGDSHFGDSIGDAFWVKRENAGLPTAAQHESPYSADGVRQSMPSRVRIENTQVNTGYSTAGDTSAWDTDASSKPSTGAAKPKRKTLKTRKQRDMDSHPSSGEESVPVRKSNRPEMTTETKERRLNKMRNLPVFLRSLTADSLPVEVFGESIPPGRLDSYLDLRDIFPSRHYMMHFADIQAKYDLDNDRVKCIYGLCVELEPDYPQCQDMVKWLVQKQLIQVAPEYATGETFDEFLARGAFKASAWNVLARGDRTQRECELEATNAMLMKQVEDMQANMQAMVQRAVAAAMQQTMKTFMPAPPVAATPSWAETVEREYPLLPPASMPATMQIPMQISVQPPIQSASASSLPVLTAAPAQALPQRQVRVPSGLAPSSNGASGAVTTPPEDQPTSNEVVPVIFTQSDGTLASSESQDFKLSDSKQVKL